MTVLAGTIWGQLRTSHLYAVFKGPYIYFGETGNVPPVRWKGHLTSETDFIGKLRGVDPVVAADETPVFFVGIRISVADAEPEAKRKIARRAIEAELHKRFSLNPTLVSPAISLLSSSPSVPVRHQFNFDRVSIANTVYAMIADEYKIWLSQNSDSTASVL